MAGKKQLSSGSWQYVFKKSGVLTKPLYLTFQSEEEGDDYARRLDAMLARGILPDEFQPDKKVSLLEDLIREYLKNAAPKPRDAATLRVCVNKWGRHPLTGISAEWVDQIIVEMRRVDNLSPSTIRDRIGALARCTDWGVRKKFLLLPDDPLRKLPNGYSQYTEADAKFVETKVDNSRDRRLEKGEFEKIILVLDKGVLHRPIKPYTYPYPIAIKTFFILALETAMRMSEIYTLDIEAVDFKKKTIFLDKTKNGDKRQVPMSSVALALLKEYIPNREMNPWNKELAFPFWTGDQKDRPETSNKLSKLFKNIFKDAGCEGLLFHDLRHEATSRLFERTTLSTEKIMKITGHRSHKMMMRYANLRGSDLADELW